MALVYSLLWIPLLNVAIHFLIKFKQLNKYDMYIYFVINGVFISSMLTGLKSIWCGWLVALVSYFLISKLAIFKGK